MGMPGVSGHGMVALVSVVRRTWPQSGLELER